MNIVLIGSMAFIGIMNDLKSRFEALGAHVTMPFDDDTTHPDMVRFYNEEALKRIIAGDAVLVVNEKKHDIGGYVGANTLVEIGMAFALKKPVYLLNKPDENQPNAVELAALTAGVAGEDIGGWLKNMEEMQ